MKLLQACLLSFLTSHVIAAMLRQTSHEFQSALNGTEDDSSSLSGLDKIMQNMEAKPAPSQDMSTMSMSDLLGSAKWPKGDSFDQSFASVLSGGTSSPCSAPLLGRSRLSPYGFGAHLNQFANEVALAMYSGKPLALCAPSGVRDSWSVYFQDPGFGRCESCDWGQGPRLYTEMGWDVNDGPDHTQMVEVKRYLYTKLFTLQSDSQMVVDTGLQNLGLGSGAYVGVHIRRGDKSQEVPPVPMDKYVAAVSEMCSTTGASTVFLASDDESAHGLLQELLGSSIKVVEQQRLSADAYKLRGDASRSISPPFGEEDEEKSVLIDVAALVRSSGFVGTASSNIDRLVYFQRDPAKPSVSLDEGGNDGFVTLSGQR